MSEKPEDRRNVAVPTLRRSEGFVAKIAQNGVGKKIMNRLLNKDEIGGWDIYGITSLDMLPNKLIGLHKPTYFFKYGLGERNRFNGEQVY